MGSWHELGWMLPVEKEHLEVLGGDALTSESLARLTSRRFNDRQARKITKAVKSSDLLSDASASFAPVKLAILTDCNLELCEDMLFATGLRYGLAVEIMIVEYTDILAQVMDTGSAFYRFAPDFVLYANFAALMSSLVATYEEPGASQGGLAQQAAGRLIDEVKATVDAITRNCKAQILLQTVPAGQPDLFGSSDRFQPQAFGYEVERLNHEISQMGQPIVDIARLASRIGMYRWLDDGMYHWTKVPFALAWIDQYSETVMRRLALLRGRGRKCLVLDLDNTLWGGVIGDDGLDGIALGNNSPSGEAFLAGQRYYKMLANRGVVLAVCSKNDMANALLPFEQHPDMILKKDDISCFVANWQDKPGNIRYISDALSLGLDSFVFLDDNPMERDFVRQELPQVAVPEVSDKNASLYPRMLEAAGYFEASGFTSADLSRVKDYKANAQRAQVKQSATDIDSYLNALEMVFTLEPFSAINEERIVQLINRSNQFNLTTRRYTNAQVKHMYEGADHFGFTARLVDKFADSGLIAVLICKPGAGKEAPCWEIDTWLMSCRVLGRKAEQATLLSLAKAASEAGIKQLVGRYIPTAKNGMVKDHYARLGFTKADDMPDAVGDGETIWVLDLAAFLDSEAATAPLPFTFE